MIDDAATIARTLQGRPNNDGWLCRCPVPTHGKGKGDRNPSLSIRQGSERLLVHCFGGCEPRDILDELRRRGLIESADFTRTRDAAKPAPRAPVERPSVPDPDALALWHAASPITGTLAADYLAGRGLAVDVLPSLRFLRSYAVGGAVWPAMVAAVQEVDRRLIAVQLTFIDPKTARKAPIAMPRKTIGALGRGAVRLGPVGAELGLAEGMESALGAMILAGLPAWASLGCQRLHHVAMPAEVRIIHLFADDDEPGHAAARRAAEHHRSLGREVAIRLPAKGLADWAAWAAERKEIAA